MNPFKRILITVLGVLTIIQPVQAASNLPAGGTFASGSGTISSNGNLLTINQNSLKGIIDWNTFSIAAGNTVDFKNGTGVTLNRVTGSESSAILGKLLASGGVYLLNSQGILIGRGAIVHTGGDFLASTLNVSDSAFLNTGSLLFSGASKATVINLGDLASSGGSIYLIGGSVQNAGNMLSPNGTSGLAAGSQVLLADSGSGQKVFVQAPGGDVTNSGFIRAAQAELKSNGGNIYALAGNSGGQINATGTATQDGRIWLIAANGTTNVSGSLTATKPNGTGGQIETSGAHVNTAGSKIATGKGGNWLLDPDDLTINSTLAGTIESSLNGGTNVTEQTGSGNTGNGDITVASNIAWNTGANLTLSAFRNIGVNNGVTIANTGSGNLMLRADNNSTGTGTISFAGTGKIDYSGSTGYASLLYNPSSYASPTAYSSKVLTNNSWVAPANLTVSSQMTAYMLVNNAANLQAIGTDATTLGGTYALGKSIDLSAIPNSAQIGPVSDFTGTFDGQNHSINGLTQLNAANSYYGLFYSITGNVRNLNLTNISFTDTGVNSSNFGGIARNNTGTISNVSVTGTMTPGANLTEAGGLVTYNTGTIQNSNTNVTVNASLTTTGNPWIGGIVAEDGGGIVKYSFATGSINAPIAASTSIGGLIGSVYGGVVTNSYATGAITGSTTSAVGGLIGGSSVSVTDSYATGMVQGGQNSYVGGLIGNNTGNVSNVHATGSASGGGASYVGGLLGTNSGAITNSYATGSSTTDSYNTRTASAGGLVGYNTGSISTSYATGAVTGGVDAQVGGLAGYSSAAISSSHASGSVSVGVEADNNVYAGGLVGFTDTGGTVSGSYATGSVTGAGGILGGLVGQSSEPITTSYASGPIVCNQCGLAGGLVGEAQATIATSFALGSVSSTGAYASGGLVGLAYNNLTDVYARGNLTADNSTMTGGLVGIVYGATLTRSYSSGLVSSSSGGGLVGQLDGGSTVSVSYFDNTVNSTLPGVGLGSQVGVTGESTSMLKSGALPTGFNPTVPTTVWTAPAGVYPYFGWQGPLVTINGTAYNGSSINPSAGVGVLSAGYLLASLTTNSSGFYSVSTPQNLVSAGVLTYLTTNGTANTFSDGGSTLGFTGMDLHTGTLSLINASHTTLSGLESALATSLSGASGPNFLASLPNGNLNLTPGTNLSIASNAASFTLDKPLDTTGNILISSTGNLNIAAASPVTTGSGDNITFDTAAAFSNQAGPAALNVSGNGKWLVYSQNPANDITGGLIPAFKQYNASYGLTSVAHSGSGLLYTLAPSIVVATTGATTKVYDGTDNARLTGSLATTGAVDGDTVSVTAGTATYASSNVGTGIGVTLSGINLTAVDGNIPVYGYQIGSISAALGSITPATLVYTANPSSRANSDTNPIFTGKVTGFVDNQTLVSATTGTAIFTSSAGLGSALGSYAIDGSGLSANHGNYIFIQAPGNAAALTITPASGTPTPTPMPAPAPLPAPNPPSTPNPPTQVPTTPATIVITIANVVAVDGQEIPVFSATYNGNPISGLDISSLLAGLNYKISPSLGGPGTYQITASGTAPSGYVFNFVPGTFTLIDASPVILPSQANLFPTELPHYLALSEGSASESLLSPVNSLGTFDIRTLNMPSAFSATSVSSAPQSAPLAQTSFFGNAKETPVNYFAGAKP